MSRRTLRSCHLACLSRSQMLRGGLWGGGETLLPHHFFWGFGEPLFFIVFFDGFISFRISERHSMPCTYGPLPPRSLANPKP
jgi:hypothetical protein